MGSLKMATEDNFLKILQVNNLDPANQICQAWKGLLYAIVILKAIKKPKGKTGVDRSGTTAGNANMAATARLSWLHS